MSVKTCGKTHVSELYEMKPWLIGNLLSIFVTIRVMVTLIFR